MDLNKKDILHIIGGIIGIIVFIYLCMLSIPPMAYFEHQWSQKWEIK